MTAAEPRRDAATTQRFYDIDRLQITPKIGDTIRIGCPDCRWRSDPVEVAPTGPNAGWIAFQSIDHLFRSHWATAHSRRPLRLVALPSTTEPDAVHRPFTDDGVTYCGWDGHDGCGEVWPCSTMQTRLAPSGIRGFQMDCDECRRITVQENDNEPTPCPAHSGRTRGEADT